MSQMVKLVHVRGARVWLDDVCCDWRRWRSDDERGGGVAMASRRRIEMRDNKGEKGLAGAVKSAQRED